MSWRYLVASTLILTALFGCTPKTQELSPSQPANINAAPSTTPDSASGTPPSERVPRITIEELLYKIQNNADIIIIDTRVDVETQFDIGHIEGAIPVPLAKITSGEWVPPADKEIILYCSWPDEKTSARAALELINQGFTDVKVLKGGYNAWKDTGYPIESVVK